jgi:hypothetical protein
MITLKRKIEIEAIFLIGIAVIVGIFFAVYGNNYKQQFNASLKTPRVPVVKTILAKVTVSSQISPDGIKKVVMKITQNPDNTNAYSFSVVDVGSSIETQIFTWILDSSKNMLTPFNTWSPDDQYFFVEQNTGGPKSVFVFKVNGSPFANGSNYLDVTDLFTKANTGNNFDEATGWASGTLIIINTINTDGTKGPSYWFEVPSQSVIQLSTEF